MVKSGPFDGDGSFRRGITFETLKLADGRFAENGSIPATWVLQVLMDTSIWSGELLNSSTLVAYI